MTRFIDSNVLIAYYSEPDSEHGSRSTALMNRVYSGDEHLLIVPTVILETVFTLTRKRRLPKRDVAESLLLLLRLSNVQGNDIDPIIEALERWRDQPALSFADWFHLVMAREAGAKEIYSFDQAMDRLPGVTRVEP